MAQAKRGRRAPGRGGVGVDPRRRQWIYDGLAMPPGVAVAHREAQPPQAGRVLLVGGLVAQGIAPPLCKLADGSPVALSVVARPSFGAREWLAQGWLGPERPDVVLLAMEPVAVLLPLERDLRERGARTIWLTRSSPTGIDPTLSVVQPPPWSDRMGATAASYAAWAARVWRMLRGVERTDG